DRTPDKTACASRITKPTIGPPVPGRLPNGSRRRNVGVCMTHDVHDTSPFQPRNKNGCMNDILSQRASSTGSRNERFTAMRQLRRLAIFCLLAGVGPPAAAGRPPARPWFPKAPPLPAPAGQVLRAASVEGLFRAAAMVRPGGTIIVAPGRYWL